MALASEDSGLWHALAPAEVTQRLGVDPQKGLSDVEADRRRAACGTNEIQEQRRRSIVRMLLDQFTDFMILVLVAAAIISGFVGEPPDAIAIVAIVVLNGVIGFVQEYRAERAVTALTLLAAPAATIRRNGQMMTILAARLVPGDIVLLETGNLFLPTPGSLRSRN